MKEDRALEELGLGSDPFTQGDGTLPFLLKLRERTLRLVGEPDGSDEPDSPRGRRTAQAPGAWQL